MRGFYRCLLSGFDSSLTCLSSVVFVLLSLSVKAQHNYDNQSIIYSRNGNVGIGNTNPTHKLEVVGGSQPDAALKVIGNRWAHIDLPLGSGRDGAAIHAQLVGTNNCAGCFRTALIAESKVTQTANAATNVGLFASASGASANYAAIFEKGKVGIGTTTPTEKLEVNGNIRTQENLEIPYNKELRIHRPPEWSRQNGPTTILKTGWASPPVNDYVDFKVPGQANNSAMMRFTSAGRLGIGTTNPTQKLEVNGSIQTRGNLYNSGSVYSNNIETNRLKVYGEASAKKFRTSSTGADFVFEPDYKLLKLEEVAEYVKDHKHLPDIAPAKTMQDEGIDLGEMNTKLLQKVEELTLYLIEQNKKLKKLEEKVKILEQR